MACRVRRYCIPDDVVVLSEYDEAVLALDPVLYLPLSGGAAGAIDQTGHGHNGAPVGYITNTILPNGDGATAFNGHSQYIEIPDAPELSVPTTGILAIEYWMRPDVLDFDVTQGTGPYIYHMGKLADNNDEYGGRMYNLTTYRPNRISGYSFNLVGPPPPAQNLGAGSYFQDTIVAGDWIHYVLVINTVDVDAAFTTGYTKVYKNGVLRDKDRLSDYSVVPGDGTAPLRIATADLNSFFEGAIAKFTVWDFEPDPADIIDRYRLVVPDVGGSITHLGHVGSNTAVVAGTKLSVIVGPSGVPAGSTLLAKVSHTYTAAGPTMADNKANVYTRDRTAANTGTTMRTSLFSAPVNADLEEGDVIQVTSSSAAIREVSIDAFTGITFTSPLDQVNSGQGTSTTPGTSITINTTFADSLLYGMATVEGPSSDGYTEDAGGEYTSLTRVGTTSGSGDITSNSGYRAVSATGAYRYQPTLGTSRNWLSVIGNYKAGASVPTPPALGTGNYIGLYGSNTSTSAGTTLVITVTNEGIPAGHTVLMPVGADFSAAGPTAVDSKGNTWTRDRTSPATGNTSRASLFSGVIVTPLVAGDTITITWATSVTRKVAALYDFAGILVPTTIDVQNGNANTGTNPSVSVTTTVTNTLLFGYVMAEGPVSEAYEPDITHIWSPLPRVGTTGGGVSTDDRTINAAYRSVDPVQSPSIYNPQLGVSTKYVAMQVAYRGA